MTSYTKFGSVKVNGKTKVVYHKAGSSKNYVVYKGRYVGLTKYKAMMMKKQAKKGGNIITDSVGKAFGDMKRMVTGGQDQPVGGSFMGMFTDALDKVKGGKPKKSTKKSGKKPTKKTVRKVKKATRKA